jgi:ABC-2 type transport system permease protein
MDQKMLNFYAYNSAKYEVKRDKWKTKYEVYYQRDMEYNLERMISVLKIIRLLHTVNFSPYQQHKQVLYYGISKTQGNFGTIIC